MNTRRDLITRAPIGIVVFCTPKSVLAFGELASKHGGLSRPTTSVVEAKVRTILVDQLQVSGAALTAKAKLKEDLGADSLDIVEISLQLEEAFHLHVPDGDELTWHTVTDVIRYVVKHSIRESASKRKVSSDQVSQEDQSTSLPEFNVHGEVKWFNFAKGVGFLTRASGGDVIVLRKGFRAQDVPLMREGQSVQYDVIGSGNRRHAENVRFITK